MLALYAFLIILFFIPDYFQKYNAEIIDAEYRPDFNKTFYHDLNGDGISEIVYAGYNSGSEDATILFLNLNHKVYDQWTLRGNWLVYYKPIFGDYNKNGFSEIYCLTIENDSIFLNVNELMLKGGLTIKNRFVCKAGTYDMGKTDITDWGGKLMDINGDGFDEYVFVIHSGYSKFPRNSFAYYIPTDSLTMSPPSASGILDQIHFMDLNGDDIDELTGNVRSPENISYPKPYTDSCAWLMVIDPSIMEFQFPPIRFDFGIGSIINPEFYNINGRKYIAGSIRSNAAKQSIDYLQLKLFDENGKLLHEKNISNRFAKDLAFVNPFKTNGNSFYLIDNNANTYRADTTLKLTKLYESDGKDSHVNVNKYSLIDADGDGENELLFLGGNKNAKVILYIYRQTLKEVTSIDLHGSKFVRDYHFCLIKDGTSNSPVLMLQADNYVYRINYNKSTYYFLKYPAYLIIYLLLLLVFWLLQKAQNKLAQRRFKTEKQLMRQQLTISKNQLEPHFMLNILNNIGYMFTQEDKEKAQYYFGKFTSLIHRGLKYADQVETSLAEELKFIKDYLFLQQHRIGEEFKFLIEANDDIKLTEIKIPHSLIYTFVENAIKHGLLPKEGDKNLKVTIGTCKGKTEITIIDNGIGRRQSQKLKTTGTGKGLSIVANIVEGYNKMNNRSISYQIKDLVDEKGLGIGTEVKVVV